jgi:glycosyltransferase involved in cell wall biosynthesis
MPLVRRRLGPVPLALAGSRVTPEIEALAGDGVSVLGWVPDLEPHYHRSRLFVAPLRFGAGMKGKIGEACAYGLPVVTTSVGAEGMTLGRGTDVLVADDAESFASLVADAYGDRGLWEQLAEGGRRRVAEQLSFSRVRADLAQTLKSLGLSVTEAQ